MGKNTIASQAKGETLIQPVYIGTSDVESAENFAFDVRQCASTLGEGRGERGDDAL
jgi:hypothetical protein